MLKSTIAFFVCSLITLSADSRLEQLPPLPAERTRMPAADWLLGNIKAKAEVYRGSDAREIVLNNGLISRTWRVSPNAATVAFDNLMTDQSILRGVKPEVVLELDKMKFNVGGLTGQPNYAYLRREWLD